MRRPRAGQLFALSIGLLLAVAIVGFIAGMFALDAQRDARRLVVDRIDPARLAEQAFLTAMVDQQTGVSGFAFAGDEAFLEPYERGRATAPAALARLRELTGNSPLTQQLAAAAATWHDQYAAPVIAAVRNGEIASGEALVARGEERFRGVREAAVALQDDLRDRREIARQGLEGDARRVRTIVIAFALTTLLTVLGAGLLLRRFVVAPLGDLAAEVRAVVQGSFDRHVSAEGAHEIVALGDDIDAMRERIVAEIAALETARDDLQRSNAELEQFAYVASHDLQEPLRKVASFTQMLETRYGGQLDERGEQYIAFAVDGAKRMQELINDLLAFSRVGRVGLPQRVVDCNEMVGHALAGLAVPIEESDARVDVTELPRVCGEARLLELVFANLIGNAIKFRGDDPPQIRVSAERQGDEWCFTVADNGIGIEPEYADRIFVIFQRLHSRSAYEGTGIGLAMCRKIVEFHGGRIWYDASEESGATFRFTLPVMEEPEQ